MEQREQQESGTSENYSRYWAASVQHKSLTPALPVSGSEDLILSLTFHSNITKAELTKNILFQLLIKLFSPDLFFSGGIKILILEKICVYQHSLHQNHPVSSLMKDIVTLTKLQLILS